MIGAPLPATRAPRAPQARPAAPASDDAPEAQAQQDALAVQRQTFDMQTAETAELERERQALEDIMLARIKDEDEIVKKFIELI